MFAALMIAITSIELLLQVAVFPHFTLYQVFPNIVLITIIFWLIFLDFDFAILFAAITGLFLDLYAPTFFGSHSLVFIGMLLFLRFIMNTYLPKESLFTTLFFVFLGTLFYETFLILINLGAARIQLTNFSLYAPDFFGTILPITLVLNIVVAAALWKFFQRLAEIVRYFQHRAKNS